jgi:hypothetical protein
MTGLITTSASRIPAFFSWARKPDIFSPKKPGGGCPKAPQWRNPLIINATFFKKVIPMDRQCPWLGHILGGKEKNKIMITRLGKIGRRPKPGRDQLGFKIWDGVPGTELAVWLNGLPKVREVLHRQFGDQPITEQNISNWKQNGHADWERQLVRRESPAKSRMKQAKTR